MELNMILKFDLTHRKKVRGQASSIRKRTKIWSLKQVAIDEMINARIRMAMGAFEEAEKFEKSKPKIEYYTMSYNFYKDAFGSIKGSLFGRWKCIFRLSYTLLA